MFESHVSTKKIRTDYKTKVTTPFGSESDSNFSTFNVSTSRFRQGGSVPNWKRLIASGNNATSNFIGDISTVDYTPISCKGTGRSGTTVWEGSFTGFPQGFGDAPYPGNLSSTLALNLASQRLFSQIRDTQRSFQGGAFLGELAETIHGIRHPVQGIRKLLDAYHGAVKERTRRIVNEKLRDRAVKDTWLEYQYHWSPLFHDAQEAYSTLFRKSRFFAKGEFLPIRGDGVDRSQVVQGPVPFSLAWNSFWYTSTSVNEVSVRYKGAVQGRPQSPYLSAISAWGVNPMTEFLPTVWELIPYSFLVDYFSNVGQIIDSWSACQADIAWLCSTTRKSISILTQTVRYGGFEQGTIRDGSITSPGSAVVTRRTISRGTPFITDLVPTIQFKLPGSSTRWLNIAALQRLVRLK